MRYRAWAAAHGRVVTLREKVRANPAVKRLFGAVNIWRWRNGPRWEVDPEPVAFARELKALGVERALWSHEVYDAAAARALRKLGYLSGRYTNFRDLFPTDTPLAHMWTHLRTLRLADGPDAVHRRQVARAELKRYTNQKT